MIYSSLAVLALSASAAISPTNHIHLHPKAPLPDYRVSVEVYNNSIFFRDIKIDGRVYTVQAHQGLTIKAPVGTVVYADSPMANHHRGDAILEVTPQVQKVVID
jgi:hypothetical protein